MIHGSGGSLDAAGASSSVFTADRLLDRMLAWPREAFRRSPSVYALRGSWAHCLDRLGAARDEREEVFLGHLELTQF